jgi:hypothetical protein
VNPVIAAAGCEVRREQAGSRVRVAAYWCGPMVRAPGILWSMTSRRAPDPIPARHPGLRSSPAPARTRTPDAAGSRANTVAAIIPAIPFGELLPRTLW